jgi:triacylglycerol lipase
MMSQLLRRLLLSQLLSGALLGWLLVNLRDMTLWLIVLSALLLPLLLALLMTLTTFIKSRAPAGAAALGWRTLPKEYGVGLRLYIGQMPWAWRAPEIQLNGTKIPVLLVHGYLCNHRIWNRMVKRLQRAGHPVLAIELTPLFISIDDYAPQLEQAVSALCRQTGAPQVALVGHSMGGLVIRAWLRACGAQRVARIVTLGTPHAGTQIDTQPKTPNGRQMAWHSSWLQTLAQSESPGTRNLMRIALSPQDNIVYPQCEQVLDGAQVTVFSGLGHLALSQSSIVQTWILRQLEEVASPANPATPR